MLIAIVTPFAILSTWSDWRAIGVFGAALACALIGFVDDYMKIVKRRSLGLRARTKLVLLAVDLDRAVAASQAQGARRSRRSRLRFVDYTRRPRRASIRC